MLFANRKLGRYLKVQLKKVRLNFRPKLISKYLISTFGFARMDHLTIRIKSKELTFISASQEFPICKVNIQNGYYLLDLLTLPTRQNYYHTVTNHFLFI